MKSPQQIVRDNDARQIRGIRAILRSAKKTYQPQMEFLPFFVYVGLFFILIMAIATKSFGQLTPEQRQAEDQLNKICAQIGCTVSERDL